MYLDTSVVVKLYVREPDSLAVVDATAGQRLCTSALATTEFYSALLGKERAGTISESLRNEAWWRWHQHVSFGFVQIVPISNHVLHHAWNIMRECHPVAPLRTLDAIHLATFVSLDAGPLLTTDAKMRAAARLLGMELCPLPRA